MSSEQRLAASHALWLIGAYLLVAAPHAPRVPWWLAFLAATLVGWRVYLARTRLPLPHRLILVVVVLGTTAGVYLFYGTIFGRDAGVALLLVMIALKLLETRTTRDAMLVIFLTYFLIITNFLYSQTILTALYMLGCVWVVTATMIGIHYIRPPDSLRHRLRTAAVMLAQSTPLMLVLFVLFPRIQGPLWGMPSDARGTSTGLSDTMSPGTLSKLTLSEAVAFRVAFKATIPPVKLMYWRGPVLWDYDGRTWHAPQNVYGQQEYNAQYYPVAYTVTVEPHGKSWLFALDLPGVVPAHATVTSDLQLISARPVTNRVRYEMVSFLQYNYGLDERPAALERARELPREYNPRTIALAQELRRTYRTDEAIVQAVLKMFHDQGYSYTLAPPLLGIHSVDEFLFETKSGFCEHYSSAFAVVVRAAGIPARIVTGYLGGELNPIGDYLIVRQADAHAWTEVWLKGQGWVRVDPTAAVAPARIEQGISAAVGTATALPLLMRGDYPVLRELRLTWDSIANTWNQWVLGYTPERQRSLLQRVGFDDATWRTLAALLLICTAIVTLVLALVTLRKLRVRVRDPVKLAYNAFCEKLRARGLPPATSEGPINYVERVTKARPDLSDIARRITALYVHLRYGGDSDARDVSVLQQLAKDFKP